MLEQVPRKDLHHQAMDGAFRGSGYRVTDRGRSVSRRPVRPRGDRARDYRGAVELVG